MNTEHPVIKWFNELTPDQRRKVIAAYPDNAQHKAYYLYPSTGKLMVTTGDKPSLVKLVEIGEDNP